MDDGLFECFMLLRMLAATVLYTLLILKLSQDRVGTPGQQHHPYEEWDHCFDGHSSQCACCGCKLVIDSAAVLLVYRKVEEQPSKVTKSGRELSERKSSKGNGKRFNHKTSGQEM